MHQLGECEHYFYQVGMVTVELLFALILGLMLFLGGADMVVGGRQRVTHTYVRLVESIRDELYPEE